jgi:hypothetical protein
MKLKDTDIVVDDVDRYCGARLSCFTRSKHFQGQAVTTMGSPFIISLFTDRQETANDEQNFGFCLDYQQVPC